MIENTVWNALGAALETLRQAGHQPVLAGGFAVILRGSPEVTKDFDFVLEGNTVEAKSEVIRRMTTAGFHLVSHINEQTGDVEEYVNTLEKAVSSITQSNRDILFFWNPEARVRIDLLFDFPIAARELLSRCRSVKIDALGITINVVSLKDLRDMKSIAYNYRRNPKDLRDLTFIEKLLKEGKDPLDLMERNQAGEGI